MNVLVNSRTPREEVFQNRRLRSCLSVILHPLVEIPTEMARRELGEEKGAVERDGMAR
jgi:dephospho-CoA kinase